MHTDPSDRLSQADPSTPEQWRARDGSLLTLRSITAADFDLEKAFVDGLSPQTSYLRLLSPRKLQADEIARFTDIDATRETAWIAVVVVDGVETMCGVARYVRDDTIAEWAIVLADAWQRRGLGEKLLRKLIDSARRNGVEVLSDVTFADNREMLGLARKLGFAIERETGDATLDRLTLRLRNDRRGGTGQVRE